MLKKCKRVLISVVIIASIVVLLFSDGLKINVPILAIPGIGTKVSKGNEQKINRNRNIDPPGSENKIVRVKEQDKKEPVVVDVKDIHSELSSPEFKKNQMKFKRMSEVKKLTEGIKAEEIKFEGIESPKISGKFKLLKLIIR